MKRSEALKETLLQLAKEDARVMADLLMLLNGMDVVNQYAGEKELLAIKRWRTK